MIHWVKQMSEKFSIPLVTSLNPNSFEHHSFMRQLQKDLKAQKPMNTPLQSLKITVIDFETSGFYPTGGDEILSIGAVKIRNGDVKYDETFYETIQTPELLTDDIASLTGLSAADLAEGKPLKTTLRAFYQFVGTDLLVAHHSGHEKAFLQQASHRVFGHSMRHRLLDTSFLYRAACHHTSKKTLEECCNYYRIPVEGRHHALSDAFLAARLWSASLRDVLDQGLLNLSDVYTYLSRSRIL
ncbi:exonuclease domain-containing protein [Texcoconibacillus texcoconensis]|uniref:DNA polymerase-3 subunit epsilon n=1 Tax=Texcoconibacillus texcoconensis TaxID=1095777 RepID=A0A840QQM1_9BACI|nr:exonuclease domain-containing protein [Texcoconibacillus texcoconensis]MBB5173674.1 DNA polymerase-3 subunit epsilon [Texcoconibacillus texcoconensis]